MDSPDDILIELSVADLEKLANIYENHRKELPLYYSLLHICIKSKKNGMPDFAKVFSPNNCWKVDGTFIASMPNHGHDIVLHSLDPSGKNLIEGLSKTKRFKYLRDPARRFTLFYGVDDRFYPKILHLLANEQKHEILNKDISTVWVLDKEKTTPTLQVHQDEVYVKQIEAEDVSVINSNWNYNYPDSHQKLLDLFKLIKGSGVYLKSNNQLVSWVVCSRLGQMAALKTLEECRFKGYAGLAVKHMANTLAEAGLDCCGIVDRGNAASEGLLAKLDLFKLIKGSGVYLKSNNQLVSWVVCSRLGQMAALKTLEQHRFKGYAGLAVKHMANTLAEAGLDCCGIVDRGNAASEGLLAKLGFVNLSTCHYICVHNKY